MSFSQDSLIRSFLALLLAELLALSPGVVAAQVRKAPAPPQPREVFEPLQKELQKSYLELFDEAPKLEYSAAQIERMRKYLDEAREFCTREFRTRLSNYQKQRQQLQADLKRRTASLEDPERRELHCKIQNLRILESQAQMLAEHAIPVAYENKKAKLELIEKWPEELKRIKEEIASGAYLKRPFADVKDIGVRELVPGQERDIKDGQEAVRQMKMTGLLPPELDNPAIKKYVNELAQKIARHSDLRVPLNLTLLNSKEVNAFALPGGFLFVQRGLLEAVEDEAQLAGVIA
ncbi:MAG: M48 family metalloprotease, partial [Bryobacteraceae bacterium]